MEPQEDLKTEDCKATRLTTNLAYLGGGIGISLFAVFGILNASFIGGILGINIVGSIFGYPIPGSLLVRIIVGFGMLTGVMVTGLAFIIIGMLCGWLLGTAIMHIKKMNNDNKQQQ